MLLPLLDDMSECPIGPYKGRLMKDVSACYLHRIWEMGNSESEVIKLVLEYIKDNLEELKHEYPAGKW